MTAYARTNEEDIADGSVIEAAHLNAEFDAILAFCQSPTIGAGTAGADVSLIFDGEDSDGVITWMEDEDLFKFSDAINVGVDDTGYDVKFFGATSGSFLLWDESDDALELTDSTPLKIGDSADMQIYHDGSNSYITNAIGALKLATETSGIAVTIGHTVSETTIADNLTVTGTLTGTLATAAQGSVTSLGTLTTLTVDNIITNGTTIGHTDDTDLITLADGAVTVAGTIGSGAITSTGIVTGTAFTAGSAVLAESELELLDGLTAGTAIASKVVTTDASIDTTGQRNLTISGELDAATLDISGNADIDGTLETDALSINSTAVTSTAAELNILDGKSFVDEDDMSSNSATAIASQQSIKAYVDGQTHTTNATTVTITDNESTNETNAVIFTAGGDVDGGNLGLESDGDLTYNPSSGTLAATVFSGALTGNVTGNTSGTAATVTTAAQTNITSLGTLTALTIDNMVHNGDSIIMTPTTDDTITMAAAADGAFSLVTVDTAAAAANIQITADGTVDIDSAGILTLDSGAAINIEPASGSAILLDGTISVDAGVVTGATSITSTAFVGDITGDVTGTADLATSITAAANNSTNETVYPTFVDGATGTQGIETDTGLTYNPSTGLVSSVGVTASGTVTYGSLSDGSITITAFVDEDDMSSDSATLVPTQQSVKAYIDGTGGGSMSSFQLEDDDGTEVTINDAKEIKFIGSGITTNWTDTSTGSDGDPYDLTFTVDAAQSNITSLGTLTALTVDDVAVNGKVITMTGDTDDTTVITAGSNGALDITTTDTAAAAANITITADGTFEVDATTITLDSAGDIVLDAAGNNITFKSGGTSIFDISNSSSDTVLKPMVDAKDIIFQQYDGTEVMRIDDAALVDMSDHILLKPILKDYGEVHNAIGDTGGGSDTIDLTSGNVVSATVSTGSQTIVFSNPTASANSCSFTLILTNGQSQGAVTWPGSVDWAGGTAPTLTASGVDILVFTTVNGGTLWHGAVASTDSK